MSQPQHMSQQMQAAVAQGPPYPPSPDVASVGGTPTVSVDVPILSVLIFLYLCSAAINIPLFQYNRRHGHFFVPSMLLGGFSMARVLTCVLRIVWSVKKHNVSLVIAAQIFVNAGILLVYIVNLLFAQRILRALQPKIGWNQGLRIIIRILYALIGCSLILIIVLTVYSFYTLSPNVQSYASWIRKGVLLYILIFVTIPMLVVPLAFALPRSPEAETFGEASIKSNAIILMTATCLCTIIAGFKVGTLWSPPQPATNPAWYDSKAAFYVFNFAMEILILVLYTSTRIDKRFYVPDGSSKRKSYAVRNGGNEKQVQV